MLGLWSTREKKKLYGQSANNMLLGTFTMQKAHTLWSISSRFINIPILLLNQLIIEHVRNNKAGIENPMYSKNILKPSFKEKMKSLLTIVFVSFSTVPLNVSKVLLFFFFLLYPLKLKLVLQDCLLATLLTENDQEK